MNKTTTLTRAGLLLCTSVALAGCPGQTGKLGDVGETDGDSASGGELDTEGSSSMTAAADSQSSDTVTATSGSSGTTEPDTETDDTVQACGELGEHLCCKEDRDLDGVPFAEDNADDAYNPSQADSDSDGIGDVLDLCPTQPGDPNNTADSDRDGIGNACDRCGGTLSDYPTPESTQFYMRTRNVPTNADFDGDGIGDACDNCVATPNCGDWDEGNPHSIGESTADVADCQADDNTDGVGDACEGQQLPGAAGPVGLGDADDFDQDGISNASDGCPRLPLDVDLRQACTGPDECGDDRSCSPSGFCGHLDSDADGVGDICDTCAFAPNPEQITADGAQNDDDDQDFIGAACESAPACTDRRDPAPTAFFPVASAGLCCVTELAVAEDAPDGDLLLTRSCKNSADGFTTENCERIRAPSAIDPFSSVPVRLQCDDDDCVELPIRVQMAPGIITLPPGCEPALEAAGMSVLENVGTQPPEDADARWAMACKLPVRDQDFDGLGDVCDKCPSAHDPADEPFIDVNGMLWPNDGAFCNGEYLCL